MRIIRTFLVCLLLPGAAFAGYKIPNLDDRESSPPVITGEVLEIIGNILIVESRGEEVYVNDDGDLVIGSEQAAAEEAAPAEAAKAVDTAEELVTITVDGEERQVPRADVEQAGIAALQKIETGDERLKQATAYEKSVRRLEEAVNARAEELEDQVRKAAEGSAADGDANLPDEGAVAEVIKENTGKVAEAIYSGDPDEVQGALTDLITRVVQGRPGSTPPQVDAKAFAATVVQEAREQLKADEAEEAAEQRRAVADKVNTTFATEFEELYEDDRAFRLTKAEFDGLREANPDGDAVEQMREAATAIQQILNPADPPDPLDARRAAKRSVQGDIPTSTGRAPVKKPAVKRTTRTDAAKKIAEARGQRI